MREVKTRIAKDRRYALVRRSGNAGITYVHRLLKEALDAPTDAERRRKLGKVFGIINSWREDLKRDSARHPVRR